MPFPVQIGRWGRGLARLFGVQGQVPLTLLEDVAPTLAIGPIDPFLLSEFTWGADLVQPAVVGQFSFAALVNPAGSGISLRVEEVRNNSNTMCVVGILPGAVASTQLARGRDSRVGVFGPAGSSGSGAVVGVGSGGVARLNTGVESSGRLITQSVPFTDRYVITPGFMLVTEQVAVNLAHSVVFFWRETSLAPQELVP